jgi:hypothetical protein
LNNKLKFDIVRMVAAINRDHVSLTRRIPTTNIDLATSELTQGTSHAMASADECRSTPSVERVGGGNASEHG